MVITLKRLLTWRSQSSAILIHYTVTHNNIVTNTNLTADHIARESIYTANVSKEVAHIILLLNIDGSKGGQGVMAPLKLKASPKKYNYCNRKSLQLS